MQLTENKLRLKCFPRLGGKSFSLDVIDEYDAYITAKRLKDVFEQINDLMKSQILGMIDGLVFLEMQNSEGEWVDYKSPENIDWYDILVLFKQCKPNEFLAKRYLKHLNEQILSTPSGELRNDLTDANIFLLKVLEHWER